MSDVLALRADRVVLRFCNRATIGVLATQVVWPVPQWMRVSRGLSYDEAARIVGDHFPEVKDKLLNTLQLQRQVDNAQGRHHVARGEHRPTHRVAPQATALRPGRRHPALPSGAEIGVACGGHRGDCVLDASCLVTEPASRIVQHRTEFVEPAPSPSSSRTKICGSPRAIRLTVEVEVIGDDLPSAVMVESLGGRFRMERARNHVFRFTFPSIRTSTPFQFLANGWHSEEHVATPFAMPNLAGLRVKQRLLDTLVCQTSINETRGLDFARRHACSMDRQCRQRHRIENAAE